MQLFSLTPAVCREPPKKRSSRGQRKTAELSSTLDQKKEVNNSVARIKVIVLDAQKKTECLCRGVNHFERKLLCP
jgi:hypothetical protein